MQKRIEQVAEQLQNTIFGQETAIRYILIALLAGGHVLLQGVPGVGKTRLAKTLTRLVGGSYNRIQFTPDLMPSDILGNAIFHLNDPAPEIRPGPVFANVVLADEINRTPPKTQAALLEAMEERQVSIYSETRRLPQPFFVIATQNPIEYEGTYLLPEAQLDRFLMQVNIGYPSLEAEITMLVRHKAGTDGDAADVQPIFSAAELQEEIAAAAQVTVSPDIIAYIAKLVRASRNVPGAALGASPRAATALLDCAKAAACYANRDYVVPDDVIDVVQPVLRHRIQLDSSAELEGLDTDEVVRRLVETVEVPH